MLQYFCVSDACIGLFLGPPRWASARRELMDFVVQGKINRGRHTGNPAGRHSMRTNHCPPPPFPHFLQAGCPSCRPTNSLKALKAPSFSDILFILYLQDGVQNDTRVHGRVHGAWTRRVNTVVCTSLNNNGNNTSSCISNYSSHACVFFQQARESFL